MRTPHRRRFLALLLVALPAVAGAGEPLRLAELDTEKIRALDRQRTAIIIPGGILEEHGPYLPSWSDGYMNEALTRELAAAIAKRSGWTAVVFPNIPLGSGGANEIGRKHVFPGSYTVRPATVRAVFMDLATELGEQGFKWIFVVHGHGSPGHNRALDEAGDFFHDTWGGQMVHLAGLEPKPQPGKDKPVSPIPPAAREEDGFTVHAGLVEHSMIMALRPDLVPPAVAQARTVAGHDFAELVRLAGTDGWPGYFGAPRLASAEIGRAMLEERTRARIELALQILDGLDPRSVPRYSDFIYTVPGIQGVMDAAGARDAQVEERQRQWLLAHAKTAAPSR
jgi:creatinine amidohydrolase/Fe(II)-dependent formamide hydrolase-like protein